MNSDLKLLLFPFLQPDDTVTLIDSAVDTSDLHLYGSSDESELESGAEEGCTLFSFHFYRHHQIYCH